jgi:PAS domain S-box-containing protein
VADAAGRPEEVTIPLREFEALAEENAQLRLGYARANQYIRDKINQLLEVMGTSPLRAEELDDRTLIELDPIGIVSSSFRQVLSHLHATNGQLKLAHEEIQAIFDAAGFGILVIDRDLRILACNNKLREQFAATTVAVGGPCHQAVCRLDDPARSCPFLEVFATGSSRRQEDWVIDGKHFDVVGTPVKDQQGAVTSVVMVYADITDRVRAERALRESEERYRDLFENAHDLIMSIRLDGSLEYVNRAWCETLGYSLEESTRLSIFQLLHPECHEECRSRIERLLAGGPGMHMGTIFLAKDGRKVVVDGEVTAVKDQGKMTGLRGILRDVTEKELFEEELLKREKLESVGLLAGGIAHDFNNILTAILGNINLAERQVPPGEEAHARLLEAEKATLSARDLTQQLLTFAQGGLPVRKASTIGNLLREQAAFALRGSSVSCHFDIAPDLWAAEVDEGQIGQVVNNLVINAVQATAGSGQIQVGARNARVGPGDGLALPEGRYVLISVQDKGCGIPKENLQRMFDPYFTTKKEGTGLGLAITYSIVKKHEGLIRVDSAVGEGSTFAVYLPACEAPRPAEPVAASAPARGMGRILLLDDEEIIRDVGTQMLLILGYEVAVASDGAEAVRLYREAIAAGRRFDAVIMDLTIPGGMGGKEAVAELREIDPGVRAVVSSGYSTDPVMAQFRDHGFRGVVVKPYRLGELGEAVRRVLADG